MNIVEKPVGDLVPYKNNAKIHTAEQIEQIARSIELTKGLRQPIVIDRNNVIIAGHGRYLAACRLGYKTVPCELVDDLTDDEIRAYRLIDNRIAQGEFDAELEFEELSSIDLDMSEFGFDVDVDDFEAGDDEDDDDDEPGWDKKQNEWSMRSDAFENQELAQFPTRSFYGIPEMAPTQTVGDKFWRFLDWKETDHPELYIAHFYYDDYRFMNAWRRPNKYVDRLRRFKAVVSPDFSVYTDFPRALQILSCYRRQWVGAYWQSLGLDVIPDVAWGDEDSFEYCFDGLPKGSTLSVSSVGVMRNKEWQELFRKGYNEMFRRLEPTTVLFYGDMVPDLEGNIIRVPSFYEQKRIILNKKAKEKKDNGRKR